MVSYKVIRLIFSRKTFILSDRYFSIWFINFTWSFFRISFIHYFWFLVVELKRSNLELRSSSELERVLLSIFHFFMSLSSLNCEVITPMDPINEDWSMNTLSPYYTLFWRYTQQNIYQRLKGNTLRRELDPQQM